MLMVGILDHCYDLGVKVHVQIQLKYVLWPVNQISLSFIDGDLH